MATRVTATINRKVTDGNYGSTEIGFEITDDVRDGEKISEAANRVYTYVETMLNAKLVENGLA